MEKTLIPEAKDLRELGRSEYLKSLESKIDKDKIKDFYKTYLYPAACKGRTYVDILDKVGVGILSNSYVRDYFKYLGYKIQYIVNMGTYKISW